jgi:hypothetical protein
MIFFVRCSASRARLTILRLAAFALRYILEAVDGTDNVAAAILDCLDVQTVRFINAATIAMAKD